ncbi:MAG: hypothetical protein CMN32_09710 [Saprospirales bacterium]|nr:hypothetical protein [Saprospirales bacterium]
MKYVKLLFFFVAMAFQVDAQTLFSLSPQTVTTEKPADFFTMYSYATFENLSGTDLNMRWVITMATPQPLNGHGIEWGEWSITLQDPSNWHNPATDLDSADFVLPAIPDESNDKFIMQFYPANEPGHLIVKYKVFVIDNPSESVEVTFDYTASVVSATEGEEGAVSEKIKLSPNPASTQVTVHNQYNQPGTLTVTDSAGRTILTQSLGGSSSASIHVATWPTGTYLVQFKSEGKIHVSRLVVAH